MAPPKKKPSISISDDLLGIVDATADRMGISRSEVISHLILYHGLCGGDFPLTTKILALRPVDRERIIKDARGRHESDSPPKPQAFRKWIKETVGSSDPEALENGADALVRSLLDGQA